MAQKNLNKHTNSNPELWKTYQNIRLKWLAEPLGCRTYAIITAYNPRSTTAPEATNQLNQRKLVAAISQYTSRMSEMVVGDPLMDYSEPSIAAALSKQDAIALASKFEQNAIYWVEAGQLWLIPALITEHQACCLGDVSHFIFTNGDATDE